MILDDKFSYEKYESLKQQMDAYGARIRELSNEMGFTVPSGKASRKNPWILHNYEVVNGGDEKPVLKITAIDALYDLDDYRYFSVPFSYLSDEPGAHKDEYIVWEKAVQAKQELFASEKKEAEERATYERLKEKYGEEER